MTGTNGVVEVPQDLYELLGVSADSDADPKLIQSKLCHGVALGGRAHLLL